MWLEALCSFFFKTLILNGIAAIIAMAAITREEVTASLWTHKTQEAAGIRRQSVLKKAEEIKCTENGV